MHWAQTHEYYPTKTTAHSTRQLRGLSILLVGGVPFGCIGLDLIGTSTSTATQVLLHILKEGCGSGPEKAVVGGTWAGVCRGGSGGAGAGLGMHWPRINEQTGICSATRGALVCRGVERVGLERNGRRQGALEGQRRQAAESRIGGQS